MSHFSRWLIVGIFIAGTIPLTAHAALLTTCGANCTLADFFGEFNILIKFMWDLAAILAVLMVFWGGFQLLIAGGRDGMIKDGQATIRNALVGLIIAYVAAILVNTVALALSGDHTNSPLNPFAGQVAVLFPQDKKLKQTVGQDTGAVKTAGCTGSGWSTSCSNQAFCSDSGTGGVVAALQQTLDNAGCNCGTSDGCFGGNTVNCVRRFQLINGLIPSGVVDAATQTKIQGLSAGTSVACNNAAAANEANSVLSRLPAVNQTPYTGADADTTGCCAVQVSSAQTAYCVSNISHKSCAALGSASVFGVGTCTQTGNATANLCGYCQVSNGSCAQYVGSYWCTSVLGRQSTSFHPGSCSDKSTDCPSSAGGCQDKLTQ